MVLNQSILKTSEISCPIQTSDLNDDAQARRIQLTLRTTVFIYPSERFVTLGHLTHHAIDAKPLFIPDESSVPYH